MFQIKIVEKIKTHILYSVTISENPAAYEIKSTNMVETERLKKILRLRVARRIPKGTRAQAKGVPVYPQPLSLSLSLSLSHSLSHTHTHNTYCFLR
jgi:hypothetical protein